MNRHLLPASVLCLLVACQVDGAPTGITRADLQGAFCGAVMPPLTQWNGKPLPATKSGMGVVFIYPDTPTKGRTWTVETDGDQVVAWVELDTSAVGTLVGTIVGEGDPTAPPIKVGGPHTPRFDDATFFLNAATLEHAADTQASGDPCGEPSK